MKRRLLLKAMALAGASPGVLLKPSHATSGFIVGPFTDDTVKNPDENLWFNAPGKYWNSQAIHIGNAFLGLSFLGGVHEEKFAITEKTLWTGGPGEDKDYQYGIKTGGKDYLEQIRKLIISNDINNLKKADQLTTDHLSGDDKAYGHFSAFGRLSVLFQHASKQYTNYSRNLNLANAVSNVQYEINDVLFKRSYFCSYPDRVAVLNFSASKEGMLSFRLRWNIFQHQHTITFAGNIYELSGKINGNNRAFNLKIDIGDKAGRVFLEGKDLVVEGGTAVTLIIAAATEYTAQPPLFNGADPDYITRQQIEKARSYSTAQLKDRHTRDYKALYDRVDLKIPALTRANLLPTNMRWRNYATSPEKDPTLKVLYFNLSRYLLISASRPGSLPANLQGGWNMFEAAQWSGNYQSNINLQLNYNSAASVNLLECQTPYIDYIRNLVEPGKAVAKAYYGSDGWVSHAIGNIWGYAAPGFEITWGMYPVAAAWHCHYIWKHFVYSEDLLYLKETGYPVLKEAALFWLQNLTAFQGHLISAPSASAEHGVYLKDGQMLASGSSYGQDIVNLPCDFQDIQMIGELLDNTLKAAARLGIDDDFSLKIKAAREKLMPLMVGKYGQLQEWFDDVETPECNHRHIAHLYALWPAKQINTRTPKLAEAAKVTLRMRGEDRNYKSLPHKDIYTASNWSLGLRMACWLRLHEAEHANKLFTAIITTAGFENLMTYQQVPQTEKVVDSTPDIAYFKAADRYWYPVFQVDASMAIAGFIAEMLLQTESDGTLFLLPALPKEWPDGKVSGLKAEGNLTVDLEWKNLSVTKYRIFSQTPVTLKVCINGKNSTIKTSGQYYHPA